MAIDGYPTGQDFESQDHQSFGSTTSPDLAGEYSYARLSPDFGGHEPAMQGSIAMEGTTENNLAGANWPAYTFPAYNAPNAILGPSAACGITQSTVAASPGPDGPVYLDIPVDPTDGNLTVAAHGSGGRKADDTDEVDPCHLHSHRPKHSQSSGLMSNNSKGSSTTVTSSKVQDDETPATRGRDTKVDKDDVQELSQNPSNGGCSGGCVRLRKACRKTKRLPSSLPRPAETGDQQRARVGHNQVEKQYRNRLNLQFERLLSSLPGPLTDEDHGRRLSKAEVLNKARRRIKSLENECEALKQQCSIARYAAISRAS